MPSDLADKAILLLAPNIGNANAKSLVIEACKNINSDIETLIIASLCLSWNILKNHLFHV